MTFVLQIGKFNSKALERKKLVRTVMQPVRGQSRQEPGSPDSGRYSAHPTGAPSLMSDGLLASAQSCCFLC